MAQCITLRILLPLLCVLLAVTYCSIAKEQRNLARESANRSGLTRKGGVIQVATCKLVETEVRLDSNDDSIKYYPRCVRVMRCSGCCYSTGTNCQPTNYTTVNYEVTMLNMSIVEVESRAKPLGSRVKVNVSINIHTGCACGLTEKKEDCNGAQYYNEAEYRCECKDQEAVTRCKNDERKHWNPQKCSCDWITHGECSNGLYFDKQLMRCLPTLYPDEDPDISNPEDKHKERF